MVSVEEKFERIRIEIRTVGSLMLWFMWEIIRVFIGEGVVG